MPPLTARLAPLRTVCVMAFDVARVRGLFPALGDGWIHLDAPAGMQVPEQVATAVSTALRAPVSGPGGVFPASQRAEAHRRRRPPGHRRPRRRRPGRCRARAQLRQCCCNGSPTRWPTAGSSATRSSCPGSTTSRTSRRGCGSPSAPARRSAGPRSTSRPASCPPGSTTSLITDRTKVVAVTAASGVVGTRPDLNKITAVARARRGAGRGGRLRRRRRSCRWTSTRMGADVVAVSADRVGRPDGRRARVRRPVPARPAAGLSRSGPTSARPGPAGARPARVPAARRAGRVRRLPRGPRRRGDRHAPRAAADLARLGQVLPGGPARQADQRTARACGTSRSSATPCAGSPRSRSRSPTSRRPTASCTWPSGASARSPTTCRAGCSPRSASAEVGGAVRVGPRALHERGRGGRPGAGGGRTGLRAGDHSWTTRSPASSLISRPCTASVR